MGNCAGRRGKLTGILYFVLLVNGCPRNIWKRCAHWVFRGLPLVRNALTCRKRWSCFTNISVSNADSLMYEEVVRILEYIQAHASVQDDNGVIHNANIIWGTSEKPQLGNAIELVVVATGFSGDASVDVMKQIIPPARITEPVKEPVAPVLEPIKPVAPPQRPPEQVMLGAKSTRYNNIELLLAKPAYQSRNSKFIVQMPGGRKEVLREESENSQQAADSQSGSLFD